MNQGNTVTQADFVIIGAGSAGCVLANRLSEDPANRVVLLEAGGECRHPLIDMPLTWMQAAANPRFIWGNQSEPDPARLGRTEAIPRGRLPGRLLFDQRHHVCARPRRRL